MDDTSDKPDDHVDAVSAPPVQRPTRVVDPPPSPVASDPNGLSSARSQARREVYAMIAKSLPLEGRDFTVRITFAEGSSTPSVSLSGLNKFGTEWCRHMVEVFKYNNELRSGRRGGA